jgi:hypothetical protein
MKIILAGYIILVSGICLAQAPATTSATSFAKSLGIYIFPAKSQNQETQNKDDRRET